MPTQSINPRTGQPFGPTFPDTDQTTYEAVVGAAADAATPWAGTPRARRAEALRAAADALDAMADTLVPLADDETGLGLSKLSGELTRTTFQLRLFADLVMDGSYQDPIIDKADSRPAPAGHPELRRMLVPLGPVAVYGASNFPFAFSVAGGDTASALAAGCPAVVKAHPGHPQTSDAVGRIVASALRMLDAPAGTFGVIHGYEQGRRLVSDPRIRAAAFTGSFAGGRALLDAAASRPDPIPFYGELGSVNPVFVTARAAEHAEDLSTGYLESLTLGNGQFCTKPGVIVVPDSSLLLGCISDRATQRPQAALLTEGTATLFDRNLATLLATPGVRSTVEPFRHEQAGFVRGTSILATTAAAALANPSVLHIECFGPAGLVVEYSSEEEAIQLADAFPGCLVAAVHGNEDEPIAAELVGRLARIAGRIVWNGWPTGVAVTRGQQHGGPWPATTSPLHTSVGTSSIGRFLRPVAFQSVPLGLLPDDLR